MLVTEPVREAAEDRFDWSAAGEKKLKGLQKPLKTFRPRPLGAKEKADRHPLVAVVAEQEVLGRGGAVEAMAGRAAARPRASRPAGPAASEPWAKMARPSSSSASGTSSATADM